MERCVLILMFARNIQDYLDRERDELIVGGVLLLERKIHISI